MSRSTTNPTDSQTRSRRSLLAAAGGAAAGVLAAMASPAPIRAAAGDNLKLGQANSSGASQTVLLNSGLGAAFTLKTTNGSTGATGIFGWSSQTGPHRTRGVYGKADGANADGVHAVQSGPAGTGAALRAEGGQNRGIVATTGATAVEAYAIHGTVSSTSPGSDSAAVRGQNNGTGGQGVGVHGSQAGSGWGVYGYALSGIGVYGESANGTGLRGDGETYGVYGNGGNYGVFGNSGYTGVWGQGTSYGVIGINASTGVYGSGSTYAGFFAGNCHVSGTLSKAAGAFRIDHPLDPERRLLQHSFVESPDMKNVYDGVVTTDASGEATVSLPEWFEALNRDVRYQLTTIGDARAWVSQELHDSQFAVRTDTPNTKVCWQLTGIRQDAWAEAHRIAVELDKPDDERGTYLHPLEHGQPVSKGRDQAERQRMATRAG